MFVNGSRVCEFRVYFEPKEIEELIHKLRNNQQHLAEASDQPTERRHKAAILKQGGSAYQPEAGGHREVISLVQFVMCFSLSFSCEGHFVLTNEAPLILQLVTIAKSISCSLGPAVRTVLVPLLSQLEDK